MFWIHNLCSTYIVNATALRDYYSDDDRDDDRDDDDECDELAVDVRVALAYGRVDEFWRRE